MGKDISREVDEHKIQIALSVIPTLGTQEQNNLIEETMNNLYSRSWCQMNGIEYSSPDVSRAKALVYLQNNNLI